MKPLAERDIQAILVLLGDEDAEVVRAVKEKLASMGREAVLHLLAAAGPEHRAIRELEGLLRQMEDPALQQEIRNLPRTASGDVDLEQGTFVIARFGHPGADVSRCGKVLDRMAGDLSGRLSSGDHPIHVVRTLNAYIFDEQGFRGGGVADPDNSYIHRVLERRIGIPITLSVVYLLVGWRLDLPLHGVGMPGHFIVKHAAGGLETFVDPYHRGRVITRNECREIVERLNLPFDEGSLGATTNRHILLRMMNNLVVNVYLPRADERRSRELMESIRILQGTE